MYSAVSAKADWLIFVKRVAENSLGARHSDDGSRRNRIVAGAAAGLAGSRLVFIISRHGESLRIALADPGVTPRFDHRSIDASTAARWMMIERVPVQ